MRLPAPKDQPQPSPDEVEAEAEAELRRVLAMGDPRPATGGRSQPSRSSGRPPRMPPRAPKAAQPVDLPGSTSFGSSGQEITPDDEKRAITDLAMQQLAERDVRPARTQRAAQPAAATASPEEMRARALAEMAERQQRMAQQRAMAGPIRSAPTAAERARGAPVLTAAPAVTVARRDPGMPRDSGARNRDPAMSMARDSGARARSLPPGGPGSPAPTTEFARRALAKVQASAQRDATTYGQAGVYSQGGAYGQAGAHAAGGPAKPAARLRRAAAARSEPSPRVDAIPGGWRLLADLGDLLSCHVFAIDALPDVSRWLAEAVGGGAAVLLIGDDVIEEVAAWPEGTPIAAGLDGLAGKPLDFSSGLWEATHDGRTVVGDGPRPMDVLAGVPGDGIRAAAAVPLAADDLILGAVLLYRSDGDTVSDDLSEDTVALVEEAARRVAVAIANADEAAEYQSSLERETMLSASHATLAAIAILLGSLELLPPPQIEQPEVAHQYDSVAQLASQLRSQVEALLEDLPA